MKTQDLITAVSLFAENEILPGIRNDFTKFSMAGAIGVLSPIIANTVSNGNTDIDDTMLESFIRSGFASQPTLTIRIGDLLPSNWESLYPILRFGPFQNVVNFAFELDREAGETFLKYCNLGTHTSEPSPAPAEPPPVP